MSVVEHFNQKGTSIFGASMDMSKAYDMVSWVKIFEDLLKRNVDPILLWLMLHMYENQRYQVKWENSFSTGFDVKNGVRQGGVASSKLF